MASTLNSKSKEYTKRDISEFDDFNSCLSQRLAFYLENSSESDVKFYIEQDGIELPAHKMIIGIGSSILNKYVCDSSTSGDSTRITVKEISAADFKQVLRYLYTEVAVINDENVKSIWKTANSYNIAGLVKKCARYMFKVKDLQNDNVCRVYNQIWNLDIPATRTCLQLIREKTNALIENGTFFDIELNLLTNVILNKHVDIFSEVYLFERMIKWAKNKISTDGLQLSSERMRETLNGRLELIRFPTMTVTEFSHCLKEFENILSVEEIGGIFSSIVTGNNENIIFPNIPRVNVIGELTDWNNLVKGSYPKAYINMNNYKLEDETCNIVANVSTILYGFEVSGETQITLHRIGSSVPLNFYIESNEQNCVYIKLRNPIHLKPNTQHLFQVTYNNEPRSRCLSFNKGSSAGDPAKELFNRKAVKSERSTIYAIYVKYL